MILEEIKNKLLEIDPNVFYGAVDNRMRETVWDYIVFERKQMDIPTNKTGHSLRFTVHIIREAFIPEGLELQVIEKMKEISGVRVSDQGGTYDYTTKPSTGAVVEAFSIDIVKPYTG